jgi:iron complex outermembrane recepter protein
MKFGSSLIPNTIVLACLVSTGHLSAADALPDLSLEQLINIEVTSVSKKEEKLSDVAAAVTVLSNDDIRRSGATSLPEALRLVPGMNVAQYDASGWAVSSRGFETLYANKLLVLMDGRSVYSPIFAGVYWDTVQPQLEDLDRVEVIRGPGATVWGANAVNGVINIVSKSAKDTQGGLVYASGGDVHQTRDGMRYGGKTGPDTYYRVFGGYQLNDDFPTANGNPAGDNWQGAQGGFRLDHYADGEQTHLTWQGDATWSGTYNDTARACNVNTLSRWTHVLSERSSVEAQAYYDRSDRRAATLTSTIDTLDVTAQHTFGLGAQNDVIWGVGCRYMVNQLGQVTPFLTVPQNEFDHKLFSAFVQDDFKLVPDKLKSSCTKALKSL